MGRGIGEIEFLQRVIPDPLWILVALITQLGDIWFVAVLLAAVYWFYDREGAAGLVGVLVTGLALLFALKHLLGLPRPDQPLVPIETLPVGIRPVYELTATAEGFGFPSGHALTTTVVYLSLANLVDIGTRRRRYLVATSLIGVVGLSRIALGVHFLVDVVAGIALGFVLVTVAFERGAWRSHVRPTTTLGAGVLAGIGYVLASGGHPDAVVLLGGSLGAFGGWQCYVLVAGRRGGREEAVPQEHPLDRRAAIGRAILATAAVGPLLGAVGFADPLSTAWLSGAVGLGITAVLLAPSLGPVGGWGGTASRR